MFALREHFLHREQHSASLGADYYARSEPSDPRGPEEGTHRVTRGGSYLCHHSYCRRYRVSARQATEPASSTGNVGFRVAADLE